MRRQLTRNSQEDNELKVSRSKSPYEPYQLNPKYNTLYTCHNNESNNNLDNQGLLYQAISESSEGRHSRRHTIDNTIIPLKQLNEKSKFGKNVLIDNTNMFSITQSNINQNMKNNQDVYYVSIATTVNEKNNIGIYPDAKLNTDSKSQGNNISHHNKPFHNNEGSKFLIPISQKDSNFANHISKNNKENNKPKKLHNIKSLLTREIDKPKQQYRNILENPNEISNLSISSNQSKSIRSRNSIEVENNSISNRFNLENYSIFRDISVPKNLSPLLPNLKRKRAVSKISHRQTSEEIQQIDKNFVKRIPFKHFLPKHYKNIIHLKQEDNRHQENLRKLLLLKNNATAENVPNYLRQESNTSDLESENTNAAAEDSKIVLSQVNNFLPPCNLKNPTPKCTQSLQPQRCIFRVKDIADMYRIKINSHDLDNQIGQKIDEEKLDMQKYIQRINAVKHLKKNKLRKMKAIKNLRHDSIDVCSRNDDSKCIEQL